LFFGCWIWRRGLRIAVWEQDRAELEDKEGCGFRGQGGGDEMWDDSGSYERTKARIRKGFI
jgi:hypothetical protein